MYAMILAAGRGKRMLPLTATTPKPLLKAGGRALIEHQITALYQAGVRDFVINCGQFGNTIVHRVEQIELPGSKFGYSMEGEHILDTGGGIVNALPLIKSEQFIVTNADVWTDYNFRRLLEARGKPLHLVLVDNPTHNPQGDFALEDGLLSNGTEKRFTFSGIGLYQKSLFIKQRGPVFPLSQLLREAAEQKIATAEKYSGYWSDVGTPQRLKQLDQYLNSLSQA